MHLLFFEKFCSKRFLLLEVVALSIVHSTFQAVERNRGAHCEDVASPAGYFWAVYLKRADVWLPRF